MTAPLVVAAFDFDGTLTRRDTFLPFLVQLCGPLAVGRALALAAPGARSRDGLKAAVVARLLTGRPADEVARAGRRYAGEVVAGKLRPEGRARVAWHLDRGHTLVLVSASPTAYLDEVGLQLGFDVVLSTRLEVGDDGRLTGRLLGANCRGPEKVRRVRDWLAERPATVWAYGDSAGDTALLAMADHPVWVKRGIYDLAGSPTG